jgi:hypothetical protein
MHRLPLALATVVISLPAAAQYDYDPSAADERDDPGIRWFGSVKDERGKLIEGAIVRLESDRFNRVFLTDEVGRFQTSLPRETPTAQVVAKCSKPGFSLISVTKRLGPRGVKPTVQVICILRASGAVAPAATRRSLESLRLTGDIEGQRRHVWQVFARLTARAPSAEDPVFESWHGEDEVHSTDVTAAARRGIRAFARAGRTVAGEQGGAAPLLEYTLYNEPAFRHIRDQHLYRSGRLRTLLESGAPDQLVPKDRTLPAFPASAIVLKTVWWPVARDAVTALPVWDEDRNPARRGGNDYTTWRRVIAVRPAGLRTVSAPPSLTALRMEFAGNVFRDVGVVGIEAFHHVAVEAALARRLMRDSGTRKLAFLALGRPLQAGDYLIMVAANLATREIDEWVWAAFWWHDRPDDGPYGADRPSNLRAEWRAFMMQAAFDARMPIARDGGPHVCFNPWLEGRFPDHGNGGGTASNCIACHRRASLPSIDFLPVVRGSPDLAGDPAFAPHRLRTSLLWSLAMRAVP